ncbi:MAG: serine/threonine-protein kinase [Verrucomicrobiota bacterium]
MSTISELKRCPKCGGPIPAEAPQGLCPRCLLQQVCVPTEPGNSASAKSAPPTHEELAAAFPQLEILELIGQGGMGFVFKARQPKIERLVALKILPQSLAADPAFAERFTREGRMLARLNHPNIVTLHDFGQAGGFFYLLMEFVDGVNLRQAMKVGRFTPAQALAVVPMICEALQFAHNEGILHRDIKPENILLDSKGRVKIADFGIAKLVEAEESPLGQLGTAGPVPVANLTKAGKVLGTPQYMAPEQLEHPQDVDQRADIYSLGVVFYEMLTGELPLGRFAPPSEKSTVDPRVDEVVLRTLEKERERRTQTAGEVRTQVETIAATPAPAGSRRGEARSAVAQPNAEWGKRMPLLSPLQSPEVRDICAHLTKAESNQVALLGFLIGVWVVAAVFGIPFLIKSFPSPGNWIVGTVLGIIFLVTLPMLSGIGRQFLCSTAWAKEQGFTPERLKLFSLRGNNLWKGLGILLVLLSLVLFQHETISRYLGLPALIKPNPVRERQPNGAAMRRAYLPPASGSSAAVPGLAPPAPEGKLVLDTEQFQPAHPEPGELDWGFKCFVPPGHLASILFVRWTNGVPQVDPGFSGYFKVGEAGGIDIPFCSLACYRIVETAFWKGLNEDQRREAPAAWKYPESSSVTNAVRWDVNIGLGFTGSRWMAMPPYHGVKLQLPQSLRSGHQRVIRLLDFDTPEGNASHGQSGVELRIFLEPLKSPPIRMVPNEVDHTNYIAGTGLAGTMEEALRAIKEWPTEP